MSDVWNPVGRMVLVMKDEDKDKTSGGIILPSDSKIPVITCRVLALGPNVDLVNYPVQVSDRILVCPSSAVPISFETDNKRYVLDSEKILAIEERQSRKKKIKTSVDTADDEPHEFNDDFYTTDDN